MKLIDLLVQELPKVGGWPDWADIACSQLVGRIMFYRDNGLIAGEFPRIDDGCTRQEDVSREQYEAALAASQKPAWSGEGLPPVGCECEFYNDDYDVRPSCPKDGQIVKIVAHQKSKNGMDLAVFTWTGERNGLHAEVCTEMLFRPIRTEAERKRDEFINQLMKEWLFLGHDREQAGSLYDAIAAGKIPGVKLE